MKQWTIYFRDKNGSKASVVIEAEDRSGVFAELKKRGISAISVTEGASNKKPRNVAKNSALSKGRGLIAAAIVVLIAGIVAWFILMKEDNIPTIMEDSVRKESTLKVNTESDNKKKVKYPKETIAKDSKTAEPEFTDGRTSAWSKKFPKNSKWSSSTNSLGQVIEVVYLADGSHHKRISTVKAMVDNAADQTLAMVTAAMSAPGAMMPPIPVHPQAEKIFLESLKREIVINEDDTHEVKLRKADIINARAEMKRLIDSGESFSSVIQRTMEDHNHAATLRAEALRNVTELSKTDVEGAEELCKKYNAILANAGVEELTADDFEEKKPKPIQKENEK